MPPYVRGKFRGALVHFTALSHTFQYIYFNIYIVPGQCAGISGDANPPQVWPAAGGLKADTSAFNPKSSGVCFAKFAQI